MSQLSAANDRALDALIRRLRDRLLVAQEGRESGEIEVFAKLDLHHGQMRAVRWRPDERLDIEQGETD